MPMYSIQELRDEFPEIPVIGSYELITKSYLTAQQEREWHLSNNWSQDIIQPPADELLALLLRQCFINVIVIVLKQTPIPPLLNHYSFNLGSRLDGEFPEAYGLTAYVPKLYIERLQAVNRLIASSDNLSFNTVLTLIKIPNIEIFLRQCAFPDNTYKLFLKIKREFYFSHTKGFLSKISTMDGSSNLSSFMLDQFHDFLSIKELCNLKETCKYIEAQPEPATKRFRHGG